MSGEPAGLDLNPMFFAGVIMNDNNMGCVDQ